MVASCADVVSSFGFTGIPFWTRAMGAARLQQSCEQSTAARAWDMGQSASIPAIPMGQEGRIAESGSTQLIAADAGPAASRRTRRMPTIGNARFIASVNETIDRTHIGL
jgi:hypothetical protein